MSHALQFNNVCLDYPLANGQGTLHALDKLDLCVEAGESLAIIGPSGCGKSSLLRLATGLVQASSGNVLVHGSTLSKPRPDTALILQNFGLLPWKTVYQNAELGLRIQKVPAAQRKERTLAALKQVELDSFAQSYPAELSGGMQQRLALARAIATDVNLLLMDEPLSALDALLRETLQNTLLNLWKQRAYAQVLVTHSIEEAVFLGQRIVVMAPRPGRVVAVINNPHMGSETFRNEALFYEQCHAVREALEGARSLAHAANVNPAHLSSKE